ncbi:MAG TPA: AsmA family protein [Terriglobales bacterium]|jgi:AsmA protein|nr:AsmA family protein [Terriglobales bacterium]
MKLALKIVGIVIAVLIVIIIVLPFVVNVNNYRPRIESELTNALGRNVTVGNLSLSLWSGSLTADNIAIADDPSFSTSPFIKAQSLNVGVEMLPLIFSKTLHVTDLTLSQPQVNLLRDRSGKWNFSTIGSASPTKKTGAAPPSSAGQAPAPAEATKTSPATPESPKEATNPKSESSIEQNLSVGKLNIKDGQVSIADTAKATKAHVYKNVNLTVKDFSYTSQFPFTLAAELPGGGTINLDGTAGPINPNDASITPVQAKLDVKNFDVGASGFIDPSSGISGVASFNGTVNSNGTQAQSSGDATIDRLKLSPKGSPAQRSVALKYQTTYDLQPQTGQLQADVTVGKAVAKLSGTYDLHGDSPVLNMKLNAGNMPVDDLETLLPALGVTLPSGSSLQGGTLSADMSINGPVEKLVITGPVKLANTKLHGFDMGSKMSAISMLSGVKTGPDTTIQTFSSNVHVAPSGIQTNNVDLVVPSLGTVTGEGTVSPSNALDYKLKAALSGTAVSGATSLVGLGKGASIPFFIQGTASDPKFVPDVKGMLSSGLGKGLGKNLGSQLQGGQAGKGVVNAIGGMFGKKKPQ